MNQFTAENPDEIKFMVLVTYELEDLRLIAQALDELTIVNPAIDKLKKHISCAVRQAEKVYYPESEQK